METLKTTRQFELVFRKGRSISYNNVVLMGRKKKQLSGSRIGFCISRKVGKAVARNKLRRRLKEIMRAFEGRLDPKWDLVIVARQNSTSLSFLALKECLKELLQRMGTLAKN